ncbi:CASP-like protein 1U2 [Dichanthelium oligosanthes]|uniref:CASP-like protein n=1 Tax=Dichanthelium oligosanthes TaxID=888268 RepID=A0A1E5VBL7_9POAL|nr:CASP-like protein 1U2 [Dichanthelium oligosanthes]
MALALTSAVVMATASECTIYGLHGAKTTVTFKNYPPFVYMAVFNIAATILEAAAIYLQVGKGDDDDDDGAPKLSRVVLVAIDVVVQALLSSATGAVFSAVVAYGPQISACSGTAGRFCEQVSRAKFISLAASISASSSGFAKDVQLPFSVWPMSSDDC